MMISIETRINNRTINTIDVIPSEVVVHAHDKLKELENALSELQTPERQAMGGGTTIASAGVLCFMKLHDVDREKFHQFTETYANFLFANFKANPLDYAQGYEITLQNMKHAILKGTFNKDSDTFKQTCKALKIKHTYKAIDEFIGRVK